MYYSSEMEWNPKWGWENLDMFNSKGTESLKKLQLTDWEVEDEGEIDGGSYKMSASRCGSGSGGSDSELVHGYSMRSSISASTESSPYEVMKASHFGHEAYVSSPGTIIKSETEHYMADASGLSSSPLENSFVSVEPLLGLKLGKRTYFENNSNTSNINISPASVIPVSSTAGKKTKASFQNGIIPRCQVQGCNLDLSSAKEYHRKHRVCDTHSKSPRVIVGGMELRFCQQCSRFHSLTDFDEKKRSCRRRLSDHNARRRKPKQETLQFHSRKLSAQLYDGMQQMNFALEGNAAGGSNLENFYSPKFTVDKSFPWMFEKAGQPCMQNVDLPRVKIVRSNSANHLSANNGNSTHVFNQGSKEAMLTFNSNAAEQEFPRALSLLSTKPWGSTEAECIMSDQHHRLLHPVTTTTTTTTAPLLPPPPPPPIPQGIPIPLVSSDFWQVQQQSSNGFQLHNFSDYCNTTGSHFGQAQQHFRS